jgi:23S rRNA (uridine2552-2'-O)-methyltransferase
VYLIWQKDFKRNGTAVFKVFQGDMLNDLIIKLKESFERVIITKPMASRQESSEIYLVCLNFR